MVARVHDLSHVRNAEWIKPESRVRLQQVLDHTKAIIFVKDLDGRYVFANRELERAVRIPAERIIGHTDDELWPPELAEQFRTADAQVLRERSGTEFELMGNVGGQRRPSLHSSSRSSAPTARPMRCAGLRPTSPTESARRMRSPAPRSRCRALRRRACSRSSCAISRRSSKSMPHWLPPRARGRTRATCACTRSSSTAEIRENFDYALAGTPCETVVGHEFRIYPSALRERFSGDPEFRELGFESYAGFPLTDSSGAPIGLISVISRKPMVNAEFIESILKIFAVRAAARARAPALRGDSAAVGSELPRDLRSERGCDLHPRLGHRRSHRRQSQSLRDLRLLPTKR